MRILSLADTRFPIERANGVQTVETCHALARRGHEVTLVVRPDTAPVSRDPFDYYDLPRIPGLRIETVPARGSVARRRATFLLAAARQARAAGSRGLVFTRDLGVARFLLGLRGAIRVPVVYESHGLAAVVSAELPQLVSTASAPTPRKLARLTRRDAHVWRHAAGYVTITQGLCRELESRFGPRQATAVVPDGTRVPTDAAVAPGMRNPPVVCYAGHLYPWKGVDVLLHALALLDPITGLVIGGLEGEPDLARVTALADRLAPSRVTFTGAVPPGEVAARLRSADVLVLPNTTTRMSSTYTSPLKLFEYMASGRPIVASDLPALGEVLRHGENALLVPPGDARACADAILSLVHDGALARRLASAALADVRDYTWDRRAERLEALFAAVMTRDAGTGAAA